LTRESIDRLKRATVYIRVTMADGSKASGSGFFGAADANTIVLTNAHVVGMLSPDSRKPRKIEVVLNSGEKDEKTTGAVVLGVDRSSDLAVLEIQPVSGLIPRPLTVKSAGALRELDEVFVAGFPLGETLGKEITIRPSSVSSLRKKGGVLDKVQVNGGMDPGNSGGPVVDAAGDVVGVAVSVIPGRQINFAIPGERVHTILNGRINAMGTAQPYIEKVGGEKIGLPINIELIDPRKQITEVVVDVWTGDSGTGNRPPATSEPGAAPGDSEHKRYGITNVSGDWKGEVLLPPLPAGKVYWLQPMYASKNGQKHWVSASHYKLSAPPVERTPARLVLRPQRVVNRTLSMTTKNTFKVSFEDDDSESMVINTKVGLQENVIPANLNSRVMLKYTSSSRQLTQNNGPPRDSTLHAAIKNDLPRLVAILEVDAVGNLTKNDIDRQTIAGLRTEKAIVAFHTPIQQSLEALAIPVPNKEVKAGERWKEKRKLPIETPGKLEVGVVDMTYTYLGQRKRNGKDEAVIALDGLVRGDPNAKGDALGGTASGTALIDLATGQVSLAETRVVVDVQSTLKEEGERAETLKLMAILEARLERGL
jgi:hypothetical protein